MRAHRHVHTLKHTHTLRELPPTYTNYPPATNSETSRHIFLCVQEAITNDLALEVQCCTAFSAVQRFEMRYCLNVSAMGSAYVASHRDLVVSFFKVRLPWVFTMRRQCGIGGAKSVVLLLEVMFLCVL